MDMGGPVHWPTKSLVSDDVDNDDDDDDNNGIDDDYVRISRKMKSASDEK